MELIPVLDGREFINIYTKGETRLGRFLSNMHTCHLNLRGIGEVTSLEGYWYFEMTARKHPELLKLTGWDAKKRGKEIIKTEGRNPPIDFVMLIYAALKQKIESNPIMEEMLKRSYLPLVHFYYYGDYHQGNLKVVDKTDQDLPTQLWIRIRQELQGIHNVKR